MGADDLMGADDWRAPWELGCMAVIASSMSFFRR
jgi:hypothetical protein